MESWQTSLIESIDTNQQPVDIKIKHDHDKPPELTDVNEPFHEHIILNTGARNRLVKIEERQDRVKAAGEQRLANIELIRQMNRDVRGWLVFNVNQCLALAYCKCVWNDELWWYM